MKVFEQIERINKMHRLIYQRRTGSPDEFARRLNISRTCLYEYIDELCSRSVPIAYSRQDHTFYYKRPFEIRIDLQLHPVTEDEEKLYNGGQFFRSVLFSGRSNRTFAVNMNVLL